MATSPTNHAEIGTDADLERWYVASYDVVYRAVAAFVGDEQIAAECTSEAFVRAIQHWRRVSAMQNRTGWAYRVAVNHARRVHRRSAIERAIPLRPSPPADSTPSMVDSELWRAIARLPRRQREAVALRYVADLTEREVSQMMGVSEGSVSASLSVARQKLRLALEEEHREP